MPVTYSRTGDRDDLRGPRRRFSWRLRELAALLVAGILVSAALHHVYRAKTQPLAGIEAGLSSRQLLDLNALGAREDLLPALSMFRTQAEREFVARRIYYISGGLSNVGAIARLRVTSEELGKTRGLDSFRERLKDRASAPLLTGEEFRKLKPLFVVRRPDRFHGAFRTWACWFLAAFLLVHIWWSVSAFRGDSLLLPVVLLLTGAGLALMIALRDPVRDNLLFTDFAQGVAIGCVLLAAASKLDFERLFGKLSFVPLIASFSLSLLLVLFGAGPGASDAKVNLLGFQPVEVIRILLVLFLAGYFGSRWDMLRHARETRGRLAFFTRHVDIPPLEYTIPAAICVALSILFFFLQKDMGPALIFSCLFLALYGMARGSAVVPVVGLALVAMAFVVGYYAGVPHTVGERVSMWLSPWNNMVHGGDQLAHSLWAFSTGGLRGMGIGRGDPQVVPAAHTDLILSALGEEWGFLGVAAVFALYAFLVYRALRIALRAGTDYQFFLAAGLAAATALQLLLISAGALGVGPLSGVVTPFLSYGRTAMLTNFLVIAMLASISARGSERSRDRQGVVSRQAIAPQPFRQPAIAAGLVLAAAGAVVLAKAAYVQVWDSPGTMCAGTLVVQADGARRYQYNPRFLEVMREIPKGAIYDRNGLPLATSDWQELQKHRDEYRQLGIDLDRAVFSADIRHYPLGTLLFDLLGDLRTRLRWAAGNTSFVERDSARRLRGFDERPTMLEVANPKTGKPERVVRYDYRELVPLVRHLDDPQSPEMRRVLDRPRDVRMSIDARLEVRVAEILRKQLQATGKQKAAAVVLDAATGDLLAAVSLPLPPEPEGATKPSGDSPVNVPPGDANPYLDRARYGLYPPGSTFKVITAMAALRKDPQLTHKTYDCIRLPDGRVGNFIKGSKRPIRDDMQDREPHGTLDMERGIVVSCNAYFAQLGTYDVGAAALFDTATLLGIATASPNTAEQLKKSLPQSSYGQGQVVTSPFQMARVAATVANGGAMPQGRWITDETNPRTAPPETVLTADAAATLGKFMREVVTSGTGRRAGTAGAPIAGKTGTAELADAPSHAWFIGYAPYGAGGRKIAVSVLVENGVYGGTAAAPAAAEIVDAAVKLGLIQP
jgi:cell division protein FtsW (lipid II flippase)